MVMDHTINVVCEDGSVQSLDSNTYVPESLLNQGEQDGVQDTYRGLFDRTVKKFAHQAYRTLLITYKDMSMSEYENLKASNNNFEKEGDRQVLEEGLTAVGIFGLQDPLRPSIKDSITKCRTAGITVIMCTGDNIDTAIAISKNAGIVTEEQCKHEYSCMTGKNFRETVGTIQTKMVDGKEVDYVPNMKKFREVKEHLRVLARSSPEDKYLLVTGIQDCNGVVAVTGDGTNDAPALTKADVGFSMGITGTDVAKGASDIILLDDNFTSIVVALRYGRNVYDNVRKFLQFQLTVNVVAMFIVFFGSVILKDSPLNAVQMLWVNLIMDTFAALALATEPPADDILLRQPYDKNAPIVTEIMWRNVFGHSIYQALVLIIIIFAGQGWLCADYSTKCLKFAADGKTCDEYNPFYATGLYMDSNDVEQWQSLNLKAADFNTEALGQFSCLQKKQKNCTEAWYSKYENTVLPSDLEAGDETQKLLHFTFVFQIFVFMQFFNQINARKIEEGEINVFAGFFNNFLFIFVVLFTIGVQVALVEVGGKVVKTHALNANQNYICLAFGAGELIWGVIIKYIPLKFFQCISLDEQPKDEPANTMVSALKKSSTMRPRN